MKLLLDTCVMYPTVMRSVLLCVARAGAFTPLWSARILEEWARAARKLGPEGEAQARAEIALVHLVMLAVLACVLFMFFLAGPIEHVLGRTGVMVVTRLFGMLLAALSIQFILDGLRGAGLF